MQRVRAAGIALMPIQQRLQTVKQKRGKWKYGGVDFSPCSEPLTGVFRMWHECKSFGYYTSQTAIQDITSVYPRGIYEILHFKTHFGRCRILLFSSESNHSPLTLFSRSILTECILIMMKRMHAACSGSRRGEKNSLKSLSFLMMSTQRQWGAALISVTCPCASHQLHYGSISHASPANWIACEVATMMGVRATSVLLLLQKWEENFSERCCCSEDMSHYHTDGGIADEKPSCYISHIFHRLCACTA